MTTETNALLFSRLEDAVGSSSDPSSFPRPRDLGRLDVEKSLTGDTPGVIGYAPMMTGQPQCHWCHQDRLCDPNQCAVLDEVDIAAWIYNMIPSPE